MKDVKRVLALDSLRGMIMILMALDHTNAFLGPGKTGFEIWMGEFATYHGDLLAFSFRFASHLCAPGFFFLLGASMVLFEQKRQQSGWNKNQIYQYFIIRGFLLILLQFLVENPAWKLGDSDMPLYFGVLFGLGSCMLLGVFLLHVSDNILVIISASLIILTHFFLPDGTGPYIMYPMVSRILLIPGFTSGSFFLYPVLPWLGVLGLGMAFARFFIVKKRLKTLHIILMAGTSLVLFFILRAVQGFGNIRMSADTGLIGFFNVVKYPPSLVFLLITLGLNLLLIAFFQWLGSIKPKLLFPLMVLGRTPLFFYLVHLYLYFGMSVFLGPDKKSILQILPLWMTGILILFPFCLLYSHYKQKTRTDSLFRFL